jgi:hypothetical protein
VSPSQDFFPLKASPDHRKPVDRQFMPRRRTDRVFFNDSEDSLFFGPRVERLFSALMPAETLLLSDTLKTGKKKKIQFFFTASNFFLHAGVVFKSV